MPASNALRPSWRIRRNGGGRPAGSSNAVLDRISAGTSVSDLADCDLVIEAVFEDPKVKAKVLSEGGGSGWSGMRDRIQHINAAD